MTQEIFLSLENPKTIDKKALYYKGLSCSQRFMVEEIQANKPLPT